MLPSSLQLMDVKFLSVSITPREEPDVLMPAPSMDGFNFQDTSVTTSISHRLAVDDPDDPTSTIMVDFHFILPNEGKNPPPYICDIRCVGYFAIAKKAFPQPARRFNVAVVNGASMLYGIIREMIANVTSRSWYGTMLLPTAVFNDIEPYDEAQEGLVEHAREQSAESATPAKKTTKKNVRMSKAQKA